MSSGFNLFGGDLDASSGGMSDNFPSFVGNHDYDDAKVFGGRDYCPCPWNSHDNDHNHDYSPWRRLQDSSTNATSTTAPAPGDDGEIWEVVVTCLVLFFMFVCLISDFAGADSIMLAALTVFMVTEIITIPEGLAGFANEGLLTVLVLFIVAEGISRTGALDWYMGKLLGRPLSVGSAQFRLMVPIAVVSAFLNNTPVVAVMIPIVQKWGKNIRVSPQQLLIPLSFASILGGTCTLIGTSTNLIVKGLLDERYPDDPEMTIGLFDLGEYGVPIAMVGMTYILIASPFLLPGTKKSRQTNGSNPLEDNEDVLLGARLTQWSPAAGRSVKRSGLRDTGGIYLVSVHRFATGNVHRAVGQEFVLNVGDILYFTGLVEGFGSFCEEHGLEILTNEIEDTIHGPNSLKGVAQIQAETQMQVQTVEEIMDAAGSDKATEEIELGVHHTFPPSISHGDPLPTLDEKRSLTDIPVEVGTTRDSVVNADYAERLRSLNRMTDMIRGIDRDESKDIIASASPTRFSTVRAPTSDAPKVVVTIEHNLVVIGVDSRDRPGLLLDLSKGLLALNLQNHHTEASVVGGRSLSLWRCEPIGVEIADVERIWTVMTALLQANTGILAQKQRGLRVIRSRVTPVSRLLGRTALEVNFREKYKVAIVSVQRGGKNIDQALSTVVFEAGDALILQASEDSPLLQLTPPTADFYQHLEEEAAAPAAPKLSRPPSYKTLANLVKLPNLSRRPSANELRKTDSNDKDGAVITRRGSQSFNEDDPPSEKKAADGDDDFFISSNADLDGSAPNTVANGDSDGGVDNLEVSTEISDGLILRDLEVLLENNRGSAQPSREFLTAMTIAKNSQFIGKTPAQAGVNKLTGVVLISIERPTPVEDIKKSVMASIAHRFDTASVGDLSDADGMSVSVKTSEPQFTTIELEETLLQDDVLWFAGSASSVGDLRKIPGLRAYESKEVKKMNENVYDRRLVQAVIARKGPLVGKTVKEVRFRTRYGAAVIAVHREGKRIHDHPGNIVLQAGDVLLLEAGSTFIGKSAENERSFALLSEVKDSAPPRLRLLVPALIITALMLVFATLEIASLLVSALVAAILMVGLGILSEQEARDAVNWDVFITIACAFGIGTALVNSGVANAIANGLVVVGEAMGIGDAGLYGAVYLATVIISNIVTNNAAAALVFPIALDAAEQTGASQILMSYTLMLGASASFMTPFGYTTNLMIYGPGGYKSKDFLAIGGPLQVILWIFTTVLLSTPSTWISWGISFAVFVLVLFIKARSSRLP